jgi:hypothetical protein
MSTSQGDENIIEINEDSELWTTGLRERSDKPSELTDFLKKYRATACPVMGDDDVSVDEDNTSEDNTSEDNTSEDNTSEDNTSEEV